MIFHDNSQDGGPKECWISILPSGNEFVSWRGPHKWAEDQPGQIRQFHFIEVKKGFALVSRETLTEAFASAYGHPANASKAIDTDLYLAMETEIFGKQEGK